MAKRVATAYLGALPFTETTCVTQPIIAINIKTTKGGSDLVWYSIDRDIFKTESIFLQKKQINLVGSRIGLPRSLLTNNI